MSTRSVKFNIDLQANPQAAHQLEAALRRVGQQGQRAGQDMNRSFRNVGSTVGRLRGAIAALGAGLVFRQVIRNTVEQERAVAQLEARLRSTGRYTPELSKRLQEFAGELQRTTTFGDEAVISAQAVLLSFQKIGGETFPRAQKAAADLATAMGTDLENATRMVGRALDDPIRGLTALRSTGITFTDEQRKLITSLVETGRAAEAQEIILKRLESAFGGSAEAARNTLGGAIASLKNAFGDLLEGDGGGDGVRGATGAINDLTDTLNDPAVKQGFGEVVKGILAITNVAAGSIAMIGGLISEIRDLSNTAEDKSYDNALRQRSRLDSQIGFLEGDTLAARNARRVRGALGLPTVEELRRELAELDAVLYQRGRSAGSQASTPTVPLVPIVDADGDGSDGQSRGGRRGPTVRDLFGPQEEALRRQIALYGETGEAARIRYEVDQGALASLDAAQKARLIDLADELDMLREKAEAESRVNEMRREAESLIEATYSAEERYVQLVMRLDELMAAGVITLAERTRVIEHAADQLREKVTESMTQLEEFGLQAARNLQSTFAEYLFSPFDDGLRGMLRGFVDVLRKMLAEAISAQLLQRLFSGAAGGAGGGGWAGLLGAMAGAFGGGSAKGNVFRGGGMVKAFAQGGVVSGPVTFPMANGQFGLMGEAGPEAIMPLKRGPGGRLGVEMAGGTGMAPPPPVNVRSITVIGEQNLADVMFTAGNERVIVNYLDRLGFQPSRS